MELDVPTMMYISSRNSMNNTKTMHKMGDNNYYLMSPPTKEQLLLMIKIQLQVSRNTCYHFPNKSDDEIQSIIAERIDQIGPIPRYILASESDYNIHLEEVHKKVD